jgi:hypothetical protein
MLYNNLKILESFKIGKSPIYIPFFFDFRGRFYYYSSVSPTNLKFARYIYNYGVYSEEEIENNETNDLSNKIEKYDIYIKKVSNIFNIKRDNRAIKEGIF